MKPAFPVSTGMGPLSANFVAPGMSLRDWFAGMASIAHSQALSQTKLSSKQWHSEVAMLSYRTADAMLEKRKK